MAALPPNSTRADLEDHVTVHCADMCVGDPQLLSDLDDLTDDDLRDHIHDIHAAHATLLAAS